MRPRRPRPTEPPMARELDPQARRRKRRQGAAGLQSRRRSLVCKCRLPVGLTAASRGHAVGPSTCEGRLLHRCCTVAALTKSSRTRAWSLEFEIGSGTEIRTPNLAVNSRLLYRLSYPGSEMEF